MTQDDRWAGVPAEVRAKVESDSAALDRACDARRCPRCGGDVSRKVDPRQVGESTARGVWINYRCPCGWMVDRKECDA